MKGTLVRLSENGNWSVKWSDLHSFGHGWFWSFTELLPESNCIMYVDNDEIKSKPLEEGIRVEFDIITLSYDKTLFTPNRKAKLIFPEVDEFEKEMFIKEYVIKNNPLFSIGSVTTIRDGGTIMLSSLNAKQKPFYIHKDNWTLHSGYPTTEDNVVTDKSTQVYLLDRLQRYKQGLEFDLTQVNKIFEKIKL